MTQDELVILVRRIAAHASGENENQKDHVPEFNDNQRKESLGIKNREEFEKHIRETLLNRETVGFSQPNGQEFYYNRDTNTVVLLDGRGCGTAFRPESRGDYLQRKHFRQEDQQRAELHLKAGGIIAHHPELKMVRKEDLERQESKLELSRTDCPIPPQREQAENVSQKIRQQPESERTQLQTPNVVNKRRPRAKTAEEMRARQKERGGRERTREPDRD